ncbi:MAG: hypothetical protein Q8N99_07445 [Nanoarchaeota archaeon]|nr:hypothetical protein [Nanoarchaeota archaeon]
MKTFKKYIYLILILLIIILIFFYPKACGKIPVSDSVNSSCLGMNVFKTNHSNSTNSSYIQKWCSGICLEKSIIKDTATDIADSGKNTVPIISDFMGGFKKVIMPLIAIFIIIGIITWINNIKKKNKNSEVRIVKIDK